MMTWLFVALEENFEVSKEGAREEVSFISNNQLQRILSNAILSVSVPNPNGEAGLECRQKGGHFLTLWT